METYHAIQPVLQHQPMQSVQSIQSPQYNHHAYSYHARVKQGVFNDPHALSRLREVFLIVMIAVSIATLVSLIELKPTTQHGWAFFLNLCFGGMSYGVPLFLAYAGCALYSHWRDIYQGGHTLILKLLGACLFFLSIDSIGRCGECGVAMSHVSWILISTILLSSIFLMTKLSCFDLAILMRRTASEFFANRGSRAVYYPVENTYRSHQPDIIRREPTTITTAPIFNTGAQYVQDASAKQLIACLQHFDIRATVVGKEVGPVITRYEINLPAGVKSSALCNLHKEIARSMRVQNVRIVEVIPGKSCVGVELGNADRKIFSFEDLKYKLDQCGDMQLPLLLGKNTTGTDVKIVDLHDMPHLLIAGSTQSGKTNLLQSMLMSLTYQLSAQALKIILVDVKRIAFTQWKNIPHLLYPIVTDGDAAIAALNWVVEEMDRRYELMANDPQKSFAKIIVIVDEFGDLIMTHKVEVETAVTRLAQKARQSGIHLILATQRPSADVITGLIKTNISTRIALSVPDKINSRMILDDSGAAGAETLLGQGDMLLKSSDRYLERLHAPFVSDDEIRAHVATLSNQAFHDDHNFNDSNITAIDFKKNHHVNQDELFDDALEFIKQSGKASTSSIQSRFRIGYQRAASIIDHMESLGLVGKRDRYNGAREVIF
ncbi:MAG: DNA translocase FtsK [Coxiellaceae bacterium]|nr:DNA translocase FtsK [Coxiellaceae bacterium]